jgi:hypothetical protein
MCRSHVIRAAATSNCKTPTLKVERPLYEEKAQRENKTIPHWLRRQIGSILPANRDRARNKEWIVEEVRCVTASDILTEWGSVTFRNQQNKGGK